MAPSKFRKLVEEEKQNLTRSRIFLMANRWHVKIMFILVGEVGTEKWGVDNVDSRQDSRTRIAPHDTHDDVSSLAREERELSNGHAGGDAAT
eukprot:scaffold1989_cov97-Cylindrotheca_fusiformis.AAC.3